MGGIDAVKEALTAGMTVGTPEIPIRINLIAPPVYVMTCATPEKAEGLALLQAGCKVVTATDEDELAARIKKAEEENQEVDGDDDDDEEQVGMGGNKDVDSDKDEEDEGEDAGGDEE